MTVLSVQDGDTFTAILCPHCQHPQRVRLADIDAPERSEPMYMASKLQLGELLRCGPIELEYLPHQATMHVAFNRLLAYVWVRGLLVNEAMVRFGLAVLYAPRQLGPHAWRIAQAQAMARSESINIWMHPDVPPCTRARLIDIATTSPHAKISTTCLASEPATSSTSTTDRRNCSSSTAPQSPRTDTQYGPD